MKRNTADDIVRFVYDMLVKNLTPEALERFLDIAEKVKGSMSVHGFAVALQQLHRKRKHDRANNLPGTTGNR